MVKKRSKLRKRVRDWLKRRKLRKEEEPIPSFGKGINQSQEQNEQPKEI